MNIGNKLAILIGMEVVEKPKFNKISECDICHKVSYELFKFNNLKLCSECFAEQKRRFPQIKC